MKKALSVVIPVYNEKNSICNTLVEVNNILQKETYDYEIIVVNDGSTDSTLDILNKFLAVKKKIKSKVKVYSHNINKGYGASLKTGINKANYPDICITDADSTYPNNFIPKLYEEYNKGFDMVVGQRQFKKLPLITRPAKWFISTLSNFLVGEKILDINSGLRIFKKDIAVKFFPIICDGFSFTTTITLAMITNNYLIKYIPIEYFKREGKSKIKPIRDTLNFIQLIVRTVMYFNPLKIFLPISIIIFIICFALLVIGRMHWLNFTETPNDTITILFIGGVQVFVTGMIADLIDKRLK